MKPRNWFYYYGIKKSLRCVLINGCDMHLSIYSKIYTINIYSSYSITFKGLIYDLCHVNNINGQSPSQVIFTGEQCCLNLHLILDHCKDT